MAGLTRDVAIVEVPATFIENYSVQLAKNSPGEIAGWVKLNGATQPQQVTSRDSGCEHHAASNHGSQRLRRIQIRREASVMVARNSETLSRGAFGRGRSRGRSNRFPHHRNTRHKNLAERQTHFPARHFHARRSRVPRRTRIFRGRRRRPARLGQGTGMQLRPTRALSL